MNTNVHLFYKLLKAAIQLSAIHFAGEWKLKTSRLLFLCHVIKLSAKHKLKMASEDGFFRSEVLDLLFEEENDEVLDEIFNPLFMEATVEVSRSLFCIKFMKRDVCKCNQISLLGRYLVRYLWSNLNTWWPLSLIKLIMVFQILTDVCVLFLDDKSWKIHV